MAKTNSAAPTINRLLEFVQEDNGSFSATRLAFLLWGIGVLAVWSVDSIKGGSPQDVPANVVTILGILMTGKVVQKFGEKPADADSPDANGGTAKNPSP